MRAARWPECQGVARLVRVGLQEDGHVAGLKTLGAKLLAGARRVGADGLAHLPPGGDGMPEGARHGDPLTRGGREGERKSRDVAELGLDARSDDGDAATIEAIKALRARRGFRGRA